MTRERCLKKSFKDSLEDIKERMKERRNKKWAQLGKTKQVLSVNSKIANNSSTLMKSFQTNNRALALALEEEKSKLREAQDTILYLKREYQTLKFQVFALHRKLALQQGKEHSETRLIALKEIISKVVQDLLNATSLLGSANNQYNTALNQTLSASNAKECDSSNVRSQDSLAHLRHILSVDASKPDKTSGTELKDNTDTNYSDVAADSQQDVMTEDVFSTSEMDTGWQTSSHCHMEYENRNEENMQFVSSLLKNVSIRRHYSRIKTQNPFDASDGSSPEVLEQITECCQQDKPDPESGLVKNNEQYEETYVSQEKHKRNTDKTLEQPNVLPESSTPTAAPKQTDFKIVGGSQTHKERDQKRKLETKTRSRTRSRKERSHNRKCCSKEKTDRSTGSNDAYDFVFEECVHITPFRQNKVEENNTQEKNNREETKTSCNESFTSEEDSDDSQYVPCMKKSRKSLEYTTDGSPRHTRQQSRNVVNEQHGSSPDGKNRNTKKSDNSADKENVEDKPSRALQKCHPCFADITNFESTSIQTRVSHPLMSNEIKGTPRQKRRCTDRVSYKEPSLIRKLRRGDPFTDNIFLNSPIFKQKKRHNSLTKKSLPRSNEVFECVG
ncbi:shugoshin 1 isoform X2 [Lacerta agilis]|uniref:shugoshin 1 isoform X2 n=1 Tax=Lacerta agilis TaxID=80427 RepID=UPI0014194A8B|nr:shugoshin 1 isoform X2 [Lacerta agilis]